MRGPRGVAIASGVLVWSARSYCGVGLPPCSSRWLSPAPHASRRCVDDPSPVVLGSIVNRFGCCGLLRPSLRGFCSLARVGPADGCLLHSHSRLSTCGAPDATPVCCCEQGHIARNLDGSRMGGWRHEHRPDNGPASVRLDVWLWSVRIFKTRSEATTACRAGHVRLNGAPAKAAQALRVGTRSRSGARAGSRSSWSVGCCSSAWAPRWPVSATRTARPRRRPSCAPPCRSATGVRGGPPRRTVADRAAARVLSTGAAAGESLPAPRSSRRQAPLTCAARSCARGPQPASSSRRRER